MKINPNQIVDYLEESSSDTFNMQKPKIGIIDKLKQFPKLLDWIKSKKDYNIASNKEVQNIIDMLISGTIKEDDAIKQIKTAFAYNEEKKLNIKNIAEYLESKDKSGFKIDKKFVDMFKGYPKIIKFLENHMSEFGISDDKDLQNAKSKLKNGDSEDEVLKYLRYVTKTLYGEGK